MDTFKIVLCIFIKILMDKSPAIQHNPIFNVLSMSSVHPDISFQMVKLDLIDANVSDSNSQDVQTNIVLSGGTLSNSFQGKNWSVFADF